MLPKEIGGIWNVPITCLEYVILVVCDFDFFHGLTIRYSLWWEKVIRPQSSHICK